MKRLFLSLILGSTVPVFAQFGPQQVISTETLRPYQLMTHDMDRDGHIDIVAVSQETYELVWYQNEDGLGTFGDKNVINNQPALYLSIDLADWDGDGDDDIIFLENNPNEIKWIEHLDGQGTYGAETFLYSVSQGFIQSINVFDIDGDGDVDLLINNAGYINGDKLLWLENDGAGSFADASLLIQGDREFFPPLATDMDNDGDTDLLTSRESYNPSIVVWYENTGGANFTTEHIIYEFNYFASDWISVTGLNFVDINSDGWGDILIDTYVDFIGDSQFWLTSAGSGGNYNALQGREFPVSGFYDLDNDTDYDVLELGANTLFWRENEDGQGLFGSTRLITTEIDGYISARAADLNSDGYLDIVSSSWDDHKLAWYPNNFLGIDASQGPAMSLSPNPTEGIINLLGIAEVQEVTVTNLLGQQVARFGAQQPIDISQLSTGTYLLRVTTVEGANNTFKIIKK